MQQNILHYLKKCNAYKGEIDAETGLSDAPELKERIEILVGEKNFGDHVYDTYKPIFDEIKEFISKKIGFITETEEYTKSKGWITDRHSSYPTTDIEVKSIPCLLFNQISRKFTLKRCEKRQSTLKSLPPKKVNKTRDNKAVKNTGIIGNVNPSNIIISSNSSKNNSKNNSNNNSDDEK